MEKLALAVSDALSHAFRDVDIEMNVGNGRLMAYLAANGEILSRSYNGTRVTIHCRLPQKHLGRINDPDVVIRERDRQSTTEEGQLESAPSTIEDVA